MDSWELILPLMVLLVQRQEVECALQGGRVLRKESSFGMSLIEKHWNLWQDPTHSKSGHAKDAL